MGVWGSVEIASFGTTHCCPADVGILKLIPGMQIVIPGKVQEFESLFMEAYANDYPT